MLLGKVKGFVFPQSDRIFPTSNVTNYDFLSLIVKNITDALIYITGCTTCMGKTMYASGYTDVVSMSMLRSFSNFCLSKIYYEPGLSKQ